MNKRSEIVRFDREISELLELPAFEAAKRLAEAYQTADEAQIFVLALIGRLLLERDFRGQQRN